MADQPPPQRSRTWLWVTIGVLSLCSCSGWGATGLFYLANRTLRGMNEKLSEERLKAMDDAHEKRMQDLGVPPPTRVKVVK